MKLIMKIIYQQMVMKLPENYNLQEGAAFPVIYVTAYMMMFHLGNLKKNDSNSPFLYTSDRTYLCLWRWLCFIRKFFFAGLVTFFFPKISIIRNRNKDKRSLLVGNITRVTFSCYILFWQ